MKTRVQINVPKEGQAGKCWVFLDRIDREGCHMACTVVWLGTLNLDLTNKKYQANAKWETNYYQGTAALKKCQCQNKQTRQCHEGQRRIK